MELCRRTYTVLVLSSAEGFTQSILPLMTGLTSPPVTVKSVSAARRMTAERSFDFILVSSPLTDGCGVDFAVDMSGSGSAVVLLIVKSEDYGRITDQVRQRGVFTLPRPTSRSVFTTALNWMASARERLRMLEEKSLSVEEKMAEIRLVNRAKWVLIDRQSMTEPEAHRFIEKRAMDKCVTRKEIAEEIIAGVEFNMKKT